MDAALKTKGRTINWHFNLPTLVLRWRGERGTADLPVGKPFRTLTFGRLAESAGFQWRAGPVHSVGVLRVQVFILSKMEKFLLASDLGFVMIF